LITSIALYVTVLTALACVGLTASKTRVQTHCVCNELVAGFTGLHMKPYLNRVTSSAIPFDCMLQCGSAPIAILTMFLKAEVYNTCRNGSCPMSTCGLLLCVSAVCRCMCARSAKVEQGAWAIVLSGGYKDDEGGYKCWQDKYSTYTAHDYISGNLSVELQVPGTVRQIACHEFTPLVEPWLCHPALMLASCPPTSPLPG
jgi:hypothetical protein